MIEFSATSNQDLQVAVWSRLDCPIILLDDHGAVKAMNAAAKAARLENVFGFAGPRLRGLDDRVDTALVATFADALRVGVAHMRIPCPRGVTGGCIAQIFREGDPAQGEARLIMAIRALDPPHPNASELAAVFGLTPGEARAVIALLDDATLEEAAAGLKVRPNTIKTLLQRAYHKLGVSSRSAMALRVAAARPFLR